MLSKESEEALLWRNIQHDLVQQLLRRLAAAKAPPAKAEYTMQLRPEQLAAHLDKPLAPLYLLHGDEPLLVIEAGDAIRAAARKQGFDEREVIVVGTGFKWDELFLAAGNMSLFGGNKLVDLRIPSGKPGRDGSEALQRYITTLGPGIVTLITLPELDWQAKKAAWVTALSNAGISIECNAPPLARLPQWIAERMARQQQSAPRAALEFIAAHVEGNLLAAHQEIQKLGLLYPPGEVSLEQIEARGDERRPLRCVGSAQRPQGTRHGPRRAHAGRPQGRGCGAAAGALGAGHRGPQRTAAARNSAALLHAAKIDRMIKGLARGDVWDEFLQLALRLTGSRNN